MCHPEQDQHHQQSLEVVGFVVASKVTCHLPASQQNCTVLAQF